MVGYDLIFGLGICMYMMALEHHYTFQSPGVGGER